MQTLYITICSGISRIKWGIKMSDYIYFLKIRAPINVNDNNNNYVKILLIYVWSDYFDYLFVPHILNF